MVEGRMSDFNHYYKNVGIAEGMEISSGIIHEILKKLDEEEDE